MMANILITGAFGNLGSMLCNDLALSNNNHTIYCLDIKLPSDNVCEYANNYFIYDITKDINSNGCAYTNCAEPGYKPKFLKSLYTLENYMIEFDIDYVIHCAAPNSSILSFDHQELYKKTIVDGTANLLEAIEYINKAYVRDIKLIYISSSAVYGKIEQVPFKEDSVRNDLFDGSVLRHISIPNNPYGRYKLKAESLVHKSSVHSLILRCFDMFSDKYDPNTPYNFSVINKFVYLACMQKLYPEQKEQYKIVIDGDGTQSRTFMYMKNVSELIKNMIDDKKLDWDNDVYNICPNMKDLISLKEVVALLENALHIPLLVEHTEKFRQGDTHIVYGDNTKAKAKLGFKYMYRFQNSFKQLLNKTKNHIILNKGV
jgi:nucleoside-diphosphate-sugar epimerase